MAEMKFETAPLPGTGRCSATDLAAAGVARRRGLLPRMIALAAAMAASIGFIAAPAAAQSTAALVQVEIALDRAHPVKIFSLNDPKRVVVDISGAVRGVNSDDVSPLIADIRTASKPYGTRVVFDLAQPATMIEAKYKDDGSALILWLVPAANSIFEAQRSAPIFLEPSGGHPVMVATPAGLAPGRNRLTELHPVGDASAILRQLFGVRPTSAYRPANHPLSLKNPRSYHTQTRAAVDVRPIPGVSFGEFVDRFRGAGFEIIEALNEVGAGRSAHATGDHWHIVLGEWR